VQHFSDHGGLMAKNDHREAFDKILSSTLSRVLELLKFAEAKNAALLTFASAWMVATINLLSTDRALPEGLPTALKVAFILFILAALVAMWSFLPKLKVDVFHRDPLQHKNLLYFGDIATFDTGVYRTRVRERYMPCDGPPTAESYLDDLAIQVAVNSKIVSRKFAIFNIGAGLIAMAILMMAIPFIRIGVNLIFVRSGAAG
jgi:hypothetical protein